MTVLRRPARWISTLKREGAGVDATKDMAAPTKIQRANGPTDCGTGPSNRLLAGWDEGTRLGLLYVHLPFAPLLDLQDGGQAYRDVTNAVAAALSTFADDLGPNEVTAGPADDVRAWLRHTEATPDDLPLALSAHLRDALAGLAERHDILREHVNELAVSHVQVTLAGSAEANRACARALRQAQLSAWDPLASSRIREGALLERALQEQAFAFHYQPIVDVPAGRVIAYEALCRGTRPDFRFPDVIFGAAERCDRVWDLGRVLRKIAADSAAAIADSDDASQAMLFINVHPSDIDDPVFIEQALGGGMAHHAERVVFELTERAAISDYKRIKELFSILRRRGYRIAIDDLGSGYAGLTALAELEPEFIKFDMGLVRDIHLHPIKQRLLERMVEFAREIGATTISEGVECPEERDALLCTGAWAMQGYYFARPAPHFCSVDRDRFGLRAA